MRSGQRKQFVCASKTQNQIGDNTQHRQESGVCLHELLAPNGILLGEIAFYIPQHVCYVNSKKCPHYRAL